VCQTMRVTFASAGRSLAGMLEFPRAALPAPTAVLCHGLTNSMTTCPMINETADLLLSLGCMVFRFDFHGSGRSDGMFRDKLISEMVLNLQDALSFVASRDDVLQGRIGLWGRSIGGTVAAMCSSNPSVTTTTLISAVLRVRRNFYPFYVKEGKKAYTTLPAKGAGVGEVKGPFELSSQFFEELGDIETGLEEALPDAKSVLVIQGDRDQRVDVESAETIYDLVQEPRSLHIVQDCDHSYAGHVEEVLAAQRHWFAEHLL
jgi:dipeptidyl aminopeptidase/acylaminoacyl peptidase